MNDKNPGSEPVDPPTYPVVGDSMAAARKLIGPPTRGTIKIIRRYASVGIALWRIEANLRASEGPDYELEIEGDSLDEVAFALVDALQQVGFGDEPD